MEELHGGGEDHDPWPARWSARLSVGSAGSDELLMGGQDIFAVMIRITLNNPMRSVEALALGYKAPGLGHERLPNPFGGVNTHLWRGMPTSSVLFLTSAPSYTSNVAMTVRL